MPTEHFKSKESYRKNLAYRHIHDIPFRAVDVVVDGKEHRVKHSGRAVDRQPRKTAPARKREKR